MFNKPIALVIILKPFYHMQRIKGEAAFIKLLVECCSSIDAGWSSLVARRAHNPKVVGSNPAPATITNIVNSSSYCLVVGNTLRILGFKWQHYLIIAH